MKLGLQIPSFTWPGGDSNIGDKIKEIAINAENAGFYSIWVMDHFFQIQHVGAPNEPMLEGYSALSYIAGFTNKVKLGTMVTGVIYRYPGILVKTATTLDVLSGGRAYFGIGAAWFEQEAKGLGVPFPSVKERFEHLEDTLQIAKQMWSDNNRKFEGHHHVLDETLCQPQPISKPHPPILIGGAGEKKTLRFVAKYGDGCNLFGFMPDKTLTHKLNVLKKHCEDIGRPYEEIEKTCLFSFDLLKMKANDVIDKIKSWSDLGFSHAIFSLTNVHELSQFDIFKEEIIPAVSHF